MRNVSGESNHKRRAVDRRALAVRDELGRVEREGSVPPFPSETIHRARAIDLQFTELAEAGDFQFLEVEQHVGGRGNVERTVDPGLVHVVREVGQAEVREVEHVVADRHRRGAERCVVRLMDAAHARVAGVVLRARGQVVGPHHVVALKDGRRRDGAAAVAAEVESCVVAEARLVFDRVWTFGHGEVRRIETGQQQDTGAVIDAEGILVAPEEGPRHEKVRVGEGGHRLNRVAGGVVEESPAQRGHGHGSGGLNTAVQGHGKVGGRCQNGTLDFGRHAAVGHSVVAMLGVRRVEIVGRVQRRVDGIDQVLVDLDHRGCGPPDQAVVGEVGHESVGIDVHRPAEFAAVGGSLFDDAVLDRRDLIVDRVIGPFHVHVGLFEATDEAVQMLLQRLAERMAVFGRSHLELARRHIPSEGGTLEEKRLGFLAKVEGARRNRQRDRGVEGREALVEVACGKVDSVIEDAVVLLIPPADTRGKKGDEGNRRTRRIELYVADSLKVNTIDAGEDGLRNIRHQHRGTAGHGRDAVGQSHRQRRSIAKVVVASPVNSTRARTGTDDFVNG